MKAAEQAGFPEYSTFLRAFSEHLPYQPEEFPISAPSVCVYRKRIIANKINAPPSGGALIVY